ncbi:hypothetical protein niasHT_030021 [Heterodera trifolii]|uniref:Uncharacterized protein n=1 Tax=Heterodera trifolii TaxID=157864 RepID=A0ABD2JRT8_9BILA
MNTLHGSRKSMCEKLMAKGERISIRIYPFACWLICFEDFLPTEQNFRRFEVLVFQSPVVRIMLEILNITVFMELSSRKHLYFQISNFAAMIFMFIGSYGSYVIVPVGASLLHEYRFLLLFRIVDFCQLFWSVQKFVGDFFGIIDMVPIISHASIKLPSSAVAQCEQRGKRRAARRVGRAGAAAASGRAPMPPLPIQSKLLGKLLKIWTSSVFFACPVDGLRSGSKAHFGTIDATF